MKKSSGLIGQMGGVCLETMAPSENQKTLLNKLGFSVTSCEIPARASTSSIFFDATIPACTYYYVDFPLWTGVHDEIMITESACVHDRTKIDIEIVYNGCSILSKTNKPGLLGFGSILFCNISTPALQKALEIKSERERKEALEGDLHSDNENSYYPINSL